MVFTDKEDTNTNTRLNTDTDTSISVSYQYFGMLKYTEYRYDTNTDTATIYTDTYTADKKQKVGNLVSGHFFRENSDIFQIYRV